MISDASGCCLMLFWRIRRYLTSDLAKALPITFHLTGAIESGRQSPFPFFMEQYMAEGAPYLRALYYNSTKRLCGLDEREVRALWGSYFAYQSSRLRSTTGAQFVCLVFRTHDCFVCVCIYIYTCCMNLGSLFAFVLLL